MEAWMSKVISLVLLFVLTLFFGLIPTKIVPILRKKSRPDQPDGNAAGTNNKASKILSYLNCFSGGVFLGTCLLHLFPEVTERYNNLKSAANLNFSFPLNELIIACGFFLIMLIEHAVMSVHARHTKEASSHDERTAFLGGSHNSGYGTPNASRVNSLRPGDTIEVIEDRIAEGPGACHTFLNSYESNHECDQQPPHHHHPGQTHEETVQIHAIRSLMLLVALSLHTAFEGLALGLESSTSNVWTLFAAVSVHKSIIAFTMGLQFTDTFQQTAHVALYMFVYSLVCPVGVGIGTAISMLEKPGVALEAVSMSLQGVATGTFLYVTFFEVLQKELGVEEHSVSKVLIIILGFTIIACSNLLES